VSPTRTSVTHPIGISWLPGESAGKVGLTFAPGKHSHSKRGHSWERDLDADLDRLAEHHGVDALVCLLEDHELVRLCIPQLLEQAEARGLQIHRLPIPDGGVLPEPGPVKELVGTITSAASQGQTVVVHCAGGLGRTGTVAGCYLVEQGLSPRQAIEVLHRVRSRNCPENRSQERFIERYASAYCAETPAPPAAGTSRSRRSRILGTVLGAAIGDAMGHPTEFIRSFEGIRDQYGPEGVQDFELYWEREGKRFAPYTDDTQMAEAVLRGLLEGRDQQAYLDDTMDLIARRFIAWLRDPQGGHRDPGGACLTGCAALEQGVPWHEAGGANAGGCGSVMRSYPFGLVLADDLLRAEIWAVAHSRMTHGHAMATSACAAMAVGVARLLRGEPVSRATTEMVAAACRHSPKTARKMTRAIDEALDGVEPEVTLGRLLGWRGDEAIAAAVYTFIRHPDDPRAAILEATNTPGDSDSLATLVGALVGARCGVEALPREWVRDVERTDELTELALRI